MVDLTAKISILFNNEKLEATQSLASSFLWGIGNYSDFKSKTYGCVNMSAQSVKETIEHYFASLNAKDLQGVSIACHFPHFRVMGDNVVYNWESAGDLCDWFEGHVSDDGWDYSELDDVTLEKITDHKYHALIKFSRYQRGGTLIVDYKSLYIVIFKNDRWGITGGLGSG